MLCKLNKLFQDPHIQYPLNPHNAFSSYIDICKNLIANTRLDLAHDTDKIINANTPFELRPQHPKNRKTGALLIHGLLESPFQMRDIGVALQSRGVLTRAILLPGHGTIPGALLNVTYQHWIDTVRYGLEKLAEDVDRIFLVGNSTGASLALHPALQHEKIAGMILISPALKISNPFAPINHLHKLISWACERAAWFHVDPNETIDYAKYRSIAMNAADQVYQLSKAIKQSDNTTIPLFFAVTLDDAIVNANAALRYFTKQLNSNSRLIAYSGKPIAFEDQRITVRSSLYPQSRIVSLSHISLPIQPNNPHYGQHGDFAYASHVEDKTKNITYGEFTASQLELNKFLVKSHLSNVTYQRLTFNPDFEFLMTQIDQFINNLIP